MMLRSITLKITLFEMYKQHAVLINYHMIFEIISLVLTLLEVYLLTLTAPCTNLSLMGLEAHSYICFLFDF